MDDKLLSVCELTAEQKKAFKKLEKAYKECEKAGIYFANNYGNLMAFNNQADIDAYLKLRIVVVALNEGWKPKFTTDEYRYYPYFYLYTKEEVEDMDEEKRAGDDSSDTGVYCDLSSASLSARLTLKSKELAEYCGKQFQSIWADYVFWAKIEYNKL